MDYFDWSNFGTGFNPQQQGNIVGWGGGEMQNGAEQQVLAATNLFKQSFQNLVGRAPTPQELGQFQNQALTSAVNAPGDLSYSDSASLSNNFINQAFGPQIAQYQQQQQQDQLGKTQQTIQDLISKQTASTAADLTNPNSPTYQSFSGNMNNLGITPSSGAFQAGLGGVLGQNASNAINQSLGQVSLPAISGINSTNQNPYQFSIGNSNTGHLNELGDFGLQASLASKLAGDSGSSNLLGQIAAIMQGAGQAGQGYGAAKGATPSYICREMIKRGLLCDQDFEEFYIHLFPAVPYKGRAFWNYYLYGQELVNIANQVYPEWAENMKPMFFDRVMAESDPIKAVELYSDALKELCVRVAPEFWDERNLRTGLLDSAWFLPRLLFCKPYRRNFWKLIRIKMLLVYDKPRCEVHS